MSQNHIIDLFGFSKGSLYYKAKGYPAHRKSTRKNNPDAKETILDICKKKSTYGVPRVRAIAKRDYGVALSYYKIHRLMRENNLLIKRVRGRNNSRAHTGKIEVPESNMRWCSDITAIKFWNGQKLRFSYVMDCSDRSIISYILQPHIQGKDIELMMQEALFKRFSGVLPNGHGVEFLHDNGPEYIEKILQKNLKKWNVVDCNTPTYSPQSNGMSEAFNGTFKRDYVYEYPLDNVDEVRELFPKWIEEYNNYAPHSALGMLTPNEYFNLKRAA